MDNYKYLKYIPKPLLEDIVSNSCIPIIGAGFSKNAKLPKNKKMPDWNELGQAFAEDIMNFNYSNPIDAISAYCYEFSRSKMIEKLSQVLNVTTVEGAEVHESFCNIPFDIVCTTNFDFLLEESYKKVRRYSRPIIEEEQLPIATKLMDVSKSPENVTLLKLHGDLHHPNRLIATEEDYDTFLSTYPLITTYMANLLITRTPLFIGYSIDDPDFRQIWQLIKDRLGNLCRPAYTIAINQKEAYATKFTRRGVKVINIPGNSYSEVFIGLFEELKDYWINNSFTHMQVNSDEALSEISMPSDSTSRLCYFSVSSSYQLFYRSYIYPIFQEYGFTPMSYDEAIFPGENITAKVSALINRSEIVIVDSEGVSTQYELQLALNNKKLKYLVVIGEKPSLPYALNNSNFKIHYIERTNNPYSDIDLIVKSIEKFVKEVSDQFMPEYLNEPSRLLKKKEYNASVISAITLLEVTLREAIEKINIDSNSYYKSSRMLTLGNLINVAINHNILPDNKAGTLKEYIYLRNSAVHNQKNINQKDARNIVNSINDIVSHIKNYDEVAVTRDNGI